ncbi:MAG: LPS-assembly protein LptD [Proteobacteria bacterium]|nr:LPS-assembly protein LptD [Pseudomonadota bacterium]MCL2307979.1 LPS-assembly protein LptD [Pseudomonadota bacterium]
MSLRQTLQREARKALFLAASAGWLLGLPMSAVFAQSADAETPSVLALREARELSPFETTPSQEQQEQQFNLRALSREKGEQGAVFLRADRTEGTRQQIEAHGNVELRAHRETVLADWMRYDQETDTLQARGNVVMRRYGSWVTGPEIDYTRSTATGTLQSPSFYLDEVGGRGDAQTLTFDGPDVYTMRSSRFTTCEAPREDWFLYADTMKIDTQRSVGTAYNASIRFMNVPLFYSPWLEFPLNNDRKSGFLTPTIGSSNARGFELTTPYYFNLAPNYDATIAPRLMTRRGLQLNSQFRYLLGAPWSLQGHFDGEYLPSDREANRSRYLMSWKHQQGLLPWMNAYFDATRVSDDNYFADLADRLSVTSQTTLPREAGLRMWHGPFSVLTRVQNFQTLQDNKNYIQPPYNRTPHVLVSMADWMTPSLRPFDLSLSGLAEYSRFRHTNLTQGQRFVVQPTLAWRKQELGWFATGRAGLQQRNYLLNPVASAPTANKTPGVSIPVMSLDGGLIFEREGSLFASRYVQTLEPRLFYVYAPYRDQNNLPVFDTTIDDFNFTQLFSENRYIGSDRFGDANQLTLALTSRILSDNGAEMLRVMAGQRFYFSDQRVTLPGETPRSAGSSDFLLGADAQLSRALSASLLTQYNFDTSRAERFNVGVRWMPAPGKVLSGTWRYTRQYQDPEKGLTEVKQFDIAAQWPLSFRWSAVGRFNYSLADPKKVLEAIGGVEYNAGCWVIRAAIHRLATTTERTNTSFFLQLELGGLGRVGPSPLEVLRRSVPGYTISSDPARRDTTPGYTTYPEF